MNKDLEKYIKHTVGWLIDSEPDEEIKKLAWSDYSLNGVYKGKSDRINALVRLAFYRGAIRGARCVWEAMQPIEPRNTKKLGKWPITGGFIDTDIPPKY